MRSAGATPQILGMDRRVFIRVAVAAISVLTLVIYLLVRPSSFTMTGSLTISNSDYYETTGATGVSTVEGCAGKGGYSDLAEGAGVTIYGSDGAIVGVGSIDYAEDMTGFCLLKWTAKDVTGGQGSYQYEVSHRGRLTINEADARGGKASASIRD